MSSQSIVCTTCDATVPYGRLSCPACGELLASVAGAARPVKTSAASPRAARARAAAERATPAVLVDVPTPTATAVDTSLGTDREPQVAGPAPDIAGPAPDIAAATTAEITTSTSGWEPPGWDTAANAAEALDTSAEGTHAAASGNSAPRWEPPILQAVAESPAADAAHLPAAVAHVDPDAATGPANRAAAAARHPAPLAWPADLAAPEGPAAAWPADLATQAPPSLPARPAAPARSVPDAPGAYVPPVMPALPAGPPAPARAWAGQAAIDAPASTTADAPRSSVAGDLLDAARVTEFVGWLAVAGSAMAAVGFLLPWGISVIGASGVGYFDRWGLAGPYHPLVFLGLLGLLGLSLVRNPIPLWVRVGVLGLGLGALLLGLTWPYIAGLSGTGPGAMVAALGAVVLAAAGVGALASDRHVQEDQAV